MQRIYMESDSAWSRALRDPALRDLPYKVETNEYGQLVMSPLRPLHGYMQIRVADLLREHVRQPGRRVVELAIQTSKGVKVPDVAWISEDRWREYARDAEASPVSAEICVEVLSASNTAAEIDEKRRLYFAHGAVEIWTSSLEGRVRFFQPEGERPSSRLVPTFPSEIEE